MDETSTAPIQLKPALVERVWAGQRLRGLLGVDSPEGRSIGEAWELADHPAGPSGFAEGRLRDFPFGAVFRTHCREIFDLEPPRSSYPLLVKFIDAGESLSIQVHPDDERARRHNARGKSECWYILDCEPGSHVLCGFKPGVTPAVLRQAAASGDFTGALMKRPIQPGTFVNVPAGTVHAILKGTLVCEISQTSSEIARLWDWDREKTPERRLDIEAAVDYACFHPESITEQGEQVYELDTQPLRGDALLVRNRHFEVRLLSLRRGDPPLRVPLENPHGVIACVVGGKGTWSWAPERSEPISVGQTWLLPARLVELQLESGEDELRILLSRPLSFD